MHTFKLHIRNEEAGQFRVIVPALPGCAAVGENVEEAIANITEAIELYIKEMELRGEPVTDDTHTLEYTVTLSPA
jgi:predicted RNase H-like HicB family nuclease